LKRVIILADAAEDIEAARDFYETQELGVGEYCVAANGHREPWTV